MILIICIFGTFIPFVCVIQNVPASTDRGSVFSLHYLPIAYDYQNRTRARAQAADVRFKFGKST